METRAKRSISASPAGLKRLEEKRLTSGKTAETIGGLAGVSRSLAQKFFKGEPISVENFRSLCEVLGLNWEEIAGLEEIAPSVSSRKRVAFVIEGSLDDLDPTKLAKLQAMVRTLQRVTGDASLEIVDIEEGSIRLILEGSEEGIERLKHLFDDGELAEVLDTPVRAVEPIETNALHTGEAREDHLKALLISMIRSQGGLGAILNHVDLSGADLSGADLNSAILKNANLSNADLSGADLNSAILSSVDLSNADLSGADLNSAILSSVDLSNADLSGADLNSAILRRTIFSGAILRGADFFSADFFSADLSSADLSSADVRRAILSGAILNEAIVQNTQFGEGFGLTEDEKGDLKQRGAIFNGAPGDRTSINSPSPLRQ